MNRTRAFASVLLICIILCSLCLNAFAYVLIYDYNGNVLEGFTKNESGGGDVSVKDGKIKYTFPPKVEGETKRAYIYTRINDDSLKDDFSLEMKIRFDDPSKANGAIIFTEYNNGAYYEPVTFGNGKIVTKNDQLDIPDDEFRLKISKNDDGISVKVNGVPLSDNLTPPSNLFSDKFDFRFRFENTSTNIQSGETHSLTLDDIIFASGEDADSEVLVTEPLYYVNCGADWERAETVLDPYEILTTKLKLVNNSEENKDIMFIGKDGIKLNYATMAPGEIKTLSLTNSDGAVSDNDGRKFFLWEQETLTPFMKVKEIKNDGITVPKISELKALLEKASSGELWISAERKSQMQSWLDEDDRAYDPTFAEIWADVLSSDDAALTGNLYGFSQSAYILRRVAACATIYAVTSDGAYAKKAYDQMMAACDFSAWTDDARFLDIAAILDALAIGYDVLSGMDYLNNEDKGKLADAIVNKGIEAALKLYKNTDKTIWPRRDDNWNVICNSAVANAAIVLAADGRYVDKCAEALNNALRNLRYAYNEFTEDGCWNEGGSYWSYMLTYGIDLFGIMNNAFGSKEYFGYENMPWQKTTAYYNIAMDGAAERYNYDFDAGGGVGVGYALFYFAGLAGDNTLAKYRIDKANSYSFRDAIWYDSAFKDADLSKLKADFYDKEERLFSFRDNYTDNTYLAFNAGNNDYRQLDMGSFVYDWSGVRWFEDLGIDNDIYDAKGYKGDKHMYYFYRHRAEGHNCLVVDNKAFRTDNADTAPDQCRNAVGEITDYLMSDTLSYAKMDISSAYANTCDSFHRAFFLDKELKAMAVSDKFVLSDAQDTYWFAHTKATDIVIDSDGKGASLTQTVGDVEKKLYVKLVSGDGSFAAAQASPLASSPTPDDLPQEYQEHLGGKEQEKNDEYKKLQIYNNSSAGNNELLVVAIPYENKDKIDEFVRKINNTYN